MLLVSIFSSVTVSLPVRQPLQSAGGSDQDSGTSETLTYRNYVRDLESVVSHLKKSYLLINSEFTLVARQFHVLTNGEGQVQSGSDLLLLNSFVK